MDDGSGADDFDVLLGMSVDEGARVELDGNITELDDDATTELDDDGALTELDGAMAELDEGRGPEPPPPPPPPVEISQTGVAPEQSHILAS